MMTNPCGAGGVTTWVYVGVESNAGGGAAFGRPRQHVADQFESFSEKN